MAIGGDSTARKAQATDAKSRPATRDATHPVEECVCPPTTTVKITPPACRFVAKGKTKKVKAVGSPAGGTFSWSCSGAIGVNSGGSTEEVQLKGSSASAAVDDVTLTVTYTANGKSAKDTIKLTGYTITKVEAKLRGTPCLRDKSRTDTMPAKQSSSDSKTFDATAITITRGCGDLKLVASVAPAALPVKWLVERAADDAAGLGGLPTHSSDGAASRRKLTADAFGSFHVSVFHDCAGKGSPAADDAVIVMNVNIVDVKVSSSSVIPRNTLFRDNRTTAGALIVDSGSTGGTAPGVNAVYNDAEFLKHPFNVKATVALTGGGADKLRGTDKVRLGYIQTTTADSVVGTYADGRTLKEVIAVNAALADPIVGGTPAMLAFPVRDTRGAVNNATGPFIISSSDSEKSNPAGGGLERVVRYVDPPAIVLNKRHPVTNSKLASIAGTNDFDTFLSAYSTDFDENYVVVGNTNWSANYGSYTDAGGWKNTGAAITTPANLTTHSPPKRAEDLAVERCPPNFVDNLKMDAR